MKTVGSLGVAFLAFILVCAVCISGCQRADDDSIVTDIDTESVLHELCIVEDGNDTTPDEPHENILQSGFSSVVLVKIPDIHRGETLCVSTSNPLAATAELLVEINGNALIKITGAEYGRSTVTVSSSGPDGEAVLEELKVYVPQKEIYGAKFGMAGDGHLELSIGETLVDKITVYSSGHLSEGDITLSSSDTAILTAESSGISFGDYYTTFGYTVKAHSVGNATLCARLFDGTEAFLEVSVSESCDDIGSASVPQASGSDGENTENSTTNAQITYVLNTKSRKFHKPDCRGVRDMKEQNKGTFYGSREEIINMDYTPCGTCKP